MTSTSSCSKKIKTQKKLQLLPAVHQAILDPSYATNLWNEIIRCTCYSGPTILPKEIAEDILQRVPTCFQKWSSILVNLWDRSSNGMEQYGNTAVVHQGYDRYHSTVFINNEDFFQQCPWDFSTLFEHGYLDGFIFGNDPTSPHHWGISEETINGLPPPLADELKKWKRIHSSINVWIETITPEWTDNYTEIYQSIHLIRIVPSYHLNDWRMIFWPDRPRVRSQPLLQNYSQPTYKESRSVRALSADSMRRSIESNLVDKKWRLFTPILETQRCIIQGYNRIKYAGGLESKILTGDIPMSREAGEIWQEAQYDDDSYNSRTPP